MSTDSAHSLADSFDLPIGSEPTELAPNLYGQEIDASKELYKHWKDVQKFIKSTLESRGIDNVIADEISVFPGMEELFSLLSLKEYYRTQKYEVIIIDCAPTADTIRKLSFPEVGKWYLKTIFPIQRQAAKIAGPVMKGLYGLQLPTEEVFANVKNLILALDGLKEILSDEHLTSIRFVVNPEKMVIKEAQRAYTYMNLFGYWVDAIFINRIYPEIIQDNYFGKWKNLQEKHLKTIEESFPNLKLFPIELFDEEIVGLDKLRLLANHIFGNSDPASIFTEGKSIEVVEKIPHESYCLSVKMPYVDKKDLDMWVKGDELIIKTGSYRRNIILPRMLCSMALQGAKFDDGQLNISFARNMNAGVIS
jgi:arsenite/tail-anchored protein-transporting ATPase